jgi:hypothetical protein
MDWTEVAATKGRGWKMATNIMMTITTTTITTATATATATTINNERETDKHLS